MSEPHVVSALRAKRAEISGHIYDLEKKIGRLRASLLHVDAAIRLFSPGTDPDAIPPKRSYRRTRYFTVPALSGYAARSQPHSHDHGPANRDSHAGEGLSG